jgi:hypothetical protein
MADRKKNPSETHNPVPTQDPYDYQDIQRLITELELRIAEHPRAEDARFVRGVSFALHRLTARVALSARVSMDAYVHASVDGFTYEEEQVLRSRFGHPEKE